MNSKLSFNAIAATLATLGATGLVACSGQPPAKSPVQAHEVPAAKAAPAEAACGAAPTQATDSTKAAKADPTAAKTQADTAQADPKDKPAEAKDEKADPKTDDAKTADAKTADAKEKAAMKKQGAGAMASCSAARRAAHKAHRAYHPKKKRAAGAKGSCGAGTCSG